MSRPWVVVVVMVMIVFTSQFEWKQQLGNEIEASPSVSRKQDLLLGSKRRESVKEKIILSQEQNIQKLNELVRSLREQLLRCRSNNHAVNGTANPLTDHLNELERQTVLED